MNLPTYQDHGFTSPLFGGWLAAVSAATSASSWSAYRRRSDGTAATAEEIPAAELVEPPWAWDTPPTGRLLLIDWETVLMSTLPDGDGSMETAIWGRGPQNSLVVVLKTIFAWWLESSEQESSDGE